MVHVDLTEQAMPDSSLLSSDPLPSAHVALGNFRSTPPRAVNTPNIVYPSLVHFCTLSTQDDARHYHSDLDAGRGQNNMASLLS